MKNVRVYVTAEDIANATKAHAAQCVVARAVARTIPSASYIRVSDGLVRFNDSEKRMTYVFTVPGRVQAYISKYDRTGRAQPFTFRLQDPATKRMISSHNPAGRTPNGNTPKRKRKNVAARHCVYRMYGNRSVTIYDNDAD